MNRKRKTQAKENESSTSSETSTSKDEFRYDAQQTKELLDLFDKIGERQRRPVPWDYIVEMQERMRDLPEIVRFDSCTSCKGYSENGSMSTSCGDCKGSGLHLIVRE